MNESIITAKLLVINHVLAHFTTDVRKEAFFLKNRPNFQSFLLAKKKNERLYRSEENPKSGAAYSKFQIMPIIKTHPILRLIAFKLGAPHSMHLPEDSTLESSESE